MKPMNLKSMKSINLKSILENLSIKKGKHIVQNNIHLIASITYIIIFLLFIYFLYLKEGYENATEDTTIDNLLKKIESGENILVLLHAEWCGHCKNLMPTWNELMKEEEKVLKVNVGGKSEKEKQLLEQFEVQGFPTIMKFSGGESQEYTGSRTKESLKKFLNN